MSAVPRASRESQEPLDRPESRDGLGPGDCPVTRETLASKGRRQSLGQQVRPAAQDNQATQVTPAPLVKRVLQVEPVRQV